MSDAPPTPAGWYPDPNNAAQVRYWDGAAWTDHYSPVPPSRPVPPANATAPAVRASTGTVPLAAAAGAQTPVAGSGFAGWWSGLSGAAKALLIVGAVFILILLVTSIGNAFRGPSEAAPAVVTVTATPSPTPEPGPTAEATAEPVPVVVDVPAFKTQANSHLDDMTKDLDDMVVTIDENGFWRLLSNSAELSFNVGQLEALDVPTSVAAPYTQGTAGLEATIASMSDPISNQDNATLLAVIDTMRGQIQAMHDLVNSAT